MKAKEYFEAYVDKFYPIDNETGTVLPVRMEDVDKYGKELLNSFADEAEEIKKTRNVRTLAGYTGIVKELNQKWNSFCSLFEKKGRIPPLNRDVLIKSWMVALSNYADSMPDGDLIASRSRVSGHLEWCCWISAIRQENEHEDH